MPAPSLEAFRDPASVAVVGASDDPAKWGYWLARGALRGRDRRRVYFVNKSAGTVQGERTYPSITDLPEAAELVALCVPGPSVNGVVAEALARGSRAFLGITAAVQDESHLAAALAESGAKIIGPNSLGLYDSSSGLELAWGHLSPGNLAIVSQSGQLGSEIAKLAERAGLGISRLISVGNQLGVTAAELLADLVDHEQTHLVALYLEGFTDSASLIEALRSVTAAGKRVILVTTGASESSMSLAKSHTGSMTSSLDAVDALCRAVGAVRVATPTELVNVARLLSRSRMPEGRRIAILSDSGGQGGIAADTAAARGLDTPVFSVDTQHRLAALMPAGAVSLANPIDLAGAGEADLQTYATLSEELVRSGEVDAVVLSGYLGCYGEDSPSLAPRELQVIDRLGELNRATRVPLVIHSMSVESDAVSRMWDNGIPCFSGIEFVMDALALAVLAHEFPGRQLTRPAPDGRAVTPGYWAARDLLGELGIAVPTGRRVASRADLGDCAELKFPLVLKAGWLAHKTGHGGVRLGIASPEELASAYAEMHARLGDGEYVVEEQDCRPHCVEMLVGARRDRDFGPMIMVGAGGTDTELVRDTCLELAPVDHRTACTMIARLRSRPLLAGWRGSPGADIDALASIVVAVSEAIVSRTEIAELEVNPIRSGPAGSLAVDALVVPVRVSCGDPPERPLARRGWYPTDTTQPVKGKP